MVYRDPHTGQFVSDDDDGYRPAYGDHEVQIIRASAVVPQDEGNDNNSQANSGSVEPVGPSELSNDEVAELTAMYRTMEMEFIVDGTTENLEAGAFSGKGEVGVNMRPSPPTNPQFSTSDEHFGINGIAYEEDHSILDVATVGSIIVPQNDAAGSSWGGGGASADERWINWRSEFGMGPFLDADDEVNFRVEAGNRNSNAGIVVSIYLILYWEVMTVEGARPTLGPPGRSR